MAIKTVRDLFIDELRDINHAERQLQKALPKLARKATADTLRQAFAHHLEQTDEQIERLEQVSDLLEVPARGKRCEAMAGLLDEAHEMIDEITSPEVLDAALITAAQKVEHYEIAGYGSLIALAKALGHDEVADLLAQTLEEEKVADRTLNEVALSEVNVMALQAAA